MKDDPLFVLLLDKMMEICGYNARTVHLKALGKLGIAWWYEYTCTPKESEAFKNYATPLIKKKYKLSKKGAEYEYSMFWLRFGLRELV